MGAISFLGKEIAKNELSKSTGGISEFVSPKLRTLKNRAIPGSVRSANAKYKQSKAKVSENLSGNTMSNQNKPTLPTKTAAKKHSGGGMGDAYLKGLGATAATASVVGGVMGANKLYNKMKTEKIWKRLQKENPELVQSARDRENFEMLRKFAPAVASNISTARSYMERMRHTNMTPHEFVRDLTDLQKKHRDGGHAGAALQNVAERSRFDFK